ncbi:hypothetical protein [Streptomyces sp. NPDC001851]|uniref:hypothetical protein n=1 Tax=Streptomyces sp. NPDC001851 TaxID=3154529 RepID=UPI0033244788
MSDRTRDPGDERPTGRFTQPPDEDWTPEDDTAPRRSTAREPLPEERLPGEPPASTAPGPEDLTADDRTPGDTPAHPPGPAGTGTAGGAGADTGSEGLRPGTEDLASGTPDGSGGRSTESPAPDTWPTAPDAPEPAGAAPRAPSGSGGVGAPLLPHDETERWEQRMRQLAAGFVEEPRGAVEQADRALEEIVARFGEAVNRRRRTLRRSWEASEDRGPGTDTDTEQLRLALRDYRELAGRLLHL